MDETGRGEADTSASAAMSASIMPAYRAGVQRAGINRSGLIGDGQVMVPSHAEVLESIRVAQGPGAYRVAHNGAGFYGTSDGALLHEGSSPEVGPDSVHLADASSYEPPPGPGADVPPQGAPTVSGSAAVLPPSRAALTEDTLDGMPIVPHPRSASYDWRADPQMSNDAQQGSFDRHASSESFDRSRPTEQPGRQTAPDDWFDRHNDFQAPQHEPVSYGAPEFAPPDERDAVPQHPPAIPERHVVYPDRHMAHTGQTSAPPTRESYGRSFVDPTPTPVPVPGATRPAGQPPAGQPPSAQPPSAQPPSVHAPGARQPSVQSLAEPQQSADERLFARAVRPDFQAAEQVSGGAPGSNDGSGRDAGPVAGAGLVSSPPAYFDPLDPNVPVESVEASLPHRVPAPPDVPDVDLDEFEDEDEDPIPTDVDGGSLTRIASGLRTDARSAIPDELDVKAVLAAVRHVEGVQEAELRGSPGGVQTLRLELADGADPGRVSRQVARLLKERMGIAAEPRRSEIDSSQRGAMPRAGAMPPSNYSAQSAAQAAIGQQVGNRAAPQVNNGNAINHRSDTVTPRPPVQQPPAVARPQPNRPASLTDAPAPSPHPPSAPSFGPGASESSSRVVLDRVKVATFGTEATVEVRLAASTGTYVGNATGPAVDAYLLRLAAQAAAGAIDSLMAKSMTTQSPVRCFIDHAGVVPFGSCLVAIVVVLVSGDGWVEQLVGSALVAGDPRQAIARATLAAVNRRLDRLLRAMP